MKQGKPGMFLEYPENNSPLIFIYLNTYISVMQANDVGVEHPVFKSMPFAYLSYPLSDMLTQGKFF